MVLLIGIAILGFGFPKISAWYWNLAEPDSPKPELGSTVWASAVGSSAIAAPDDPPMTRDEASQKLTNPAASTPDSVERGRKAFTSFCAPCHGPGGHSDGPIAAKLLFAPPDLPMNLARRTDGYLYATIRNGGVLMPSQGSRIPVSERWDIVNYLRTIQKN